VGFIDDEAEKCGGVLGGDVGLFKRVWLEEEGVRRLVGVWLLVRRSSRAACRFTRPTKRNGGRTRRHHCCKRLAAGTAAAGQVLLLVPPALPLPLPPGHTTCTNHSSCSCAHSNQLRHITLLSSTSKLAVLLPPSTVVVVAPGVFVEGVVFAFGANASGGGDKVFRWAAAIAAARTLPRLLPRWRGLNLLLAP